MKKFIISVIIIILVIISIIFGVKSVNTFFYPVKYEKMILSAAEEYNIESSLLFAVIKTESGFNPAAESSAGARGLTQITEDTFYWLLSKTGEEYGFNDLFTPEVSIKYGALFLSILTNEYKNTSTAVAAYHAGMGNVSSWLKNSEYSKDGITLDNIPIKETAHYVYKVTKAKSKYEKLYNYRGA